MEKNFDALIGKVEIQPKDYAIILVDQGLSDEIFLSVISESLFRNSPATLAQILVVSRYVCMTPGARESIVSSRAM